MNSIERRPPGLAFLAQLMLRLSLNSPGRLLLAAIFPGAMLICGCASQPDVFVDHNPEFDFSGFRSYRWYDDEFPSKAGEYRQYNSSDRRVRTFIDRELQAAGFVPADQGDADFLVNYEISRQEQTRIDNFAGYPSRGMHGGVGVGTYGSGVSLGYSSGPSVKTYREGTVVIDVIDAAQSEVVWRGVAEGRLSKKLTHQEKDALASKLARELMAGFPPD